MQDETTQKIVKQHIEVFKSKMIIELHKLISDNGAQLLNITESTQDMEVSIQT